MQWRVKENFLLAGVMRAGNDRRDRNPARSIQGGVHALIAIDISAPLFLRLSAG
jgi:hypothetical protein